MQNFFWDNALFPSAIGNTIKEASDHLDSKLSVLYTFEQQSGGRKWRAIPNFELKAAHDCSDDKEQTFYDVSWLDIINDLKGTGTWFYDEAKEQASPTELRDLHALINFKYIGNLSSLT